MRWMHRLVAIGMLSAALVAVYAGDVRALNEGRGVGSEVYTTGGVGEEERDSLIKRRQEFNVWITTAAKQSGAYLADVRAKVVDAASRLVVETTLDGPWLFIRLKPGQYTVEVVFDGQKHSRAVTVGAQGHRELYFYFDVQVETVPREPDAKDNVTTKPKR